MYDNMLIISNGIVNLDNVDSITQLKGEQVTIQFTGGSYLKLDCDISEIKEVIRSAE